MVQECSNEPTRCLLLQIISGLPDRAKYDTVAETSIYGKREEISMKSNIVPKYYRYLVIFKNEEDDYTPILKLHDLSEIKKDNSNRMHLLDDDLISILPILKYCLHLPRTELDVCNTDTTILDKSHDTSHDIIICPASLALLVTDNEKPDLVIYDDLCCSIMEETIEENNDVIFAKKSELSSELLVKHWKSMFDRRNIKSATKVPDLECQYILDDDKIPFLPMLFPARQYGQSKEMYGRIFNSLNVFEDCATTLYNQNVHHNTLMACADIDPQNIELWKETYCQGEKRARNNTRINLVITYPGVSPYQIKLGGLSKVLPAIEKSAIRIIGTHRAIAKNALLMELPTVKEDLFNIINELELYSTQTIRPNNSYVQRTLSKIGTVFENELNAPQKWALHNAKQVTVLSDFPLGLCVLGEQETTMQCEKKFSSRALSPLTRTMQMEFIKHPQLYLGYGCKVLFIECVPNTYENKAIRECSENLKRGLDRNKKNCEKFEYICDEAYTVRDVKRIISEQSDATILLISAHGFYDRFRNISGLMIGEEEWMVDDNDFHVPPIVMLSACHVSPRGSGCVNAADLFLRAGAEAVLSTSIPINAHRNAVLYNRLFTYISEAQKGSSQYTTISDAWAGVVSTNAIYEMAEQSKKFRDWLFGKNPKGIVRIFDFCMLRANGRLRISSIYSDTKEIIKEMLAEEGLHGKFGDIIDNNNYFPECFFYQWFGFPENIFLYNEVFRDVLNLEV